MMMRILQSNEAVDSSKVDYCQSVILKKEEHVCSGASVPRWLEGIRAPKHGSMCTVACHC
jgi:hypothetical protein